MKIPEKYRKKRVRVAGFDERSDPALATAAPRARTPKKSARAKLKQAERLAKLHGKPIPEPEGEKF